MTLNFNPPKRKLSEYLAHLGEEARADGPFEDFTVEGATDNSATVRPGSVFCAVPGPKSDGHNYIADAVKRGAKAVFYSKDNIRHFEGVSFIRVAEPLKARAAVCAFYYGLPSESFNLTGVTGTNGKTTTAFLLKSIFEEAGRKSGLISTVKYVFGDVSIDADRTTPGAEELQRLFYGMRESGCAEVVMETSSHGLDQRRTGPARFKTAVFTNLTGDHLDYHGNMESYYQAKKLLFTECLDKDGIAVINADDPFGLRLLKELIAEGVSVLSYGCGDMCGFKLREIESGAGGSLIEFDINRYGVFTARTKLTGSYNAYNAAAAAAAAFTRGVPMEKVIAALGKCPAPPGRLEAVKSKSGASVFVDYAHTDDALERVLGAVRPLCKGKLTVVFGCGGDRDRTKRPKMGAAAARLADFCVITSDNPRSEDPLFIISEILKGVSDGAKFVTEPDRREAIRLAVSSARKDDIVVIAGKGHESYQEIKGQKYDFDDRAEAAKH
jgi:UDP-N-acetylmuramyl-tripeptide synthetase